MTVQSKLLISTISLLQLVNSQFQARPETSTLPQNLLDAQQQFREAQSQLQIAQNEISDQPKGRSLANLINSLKNQPEVTTDQQILTETLSDPENYEYANYEYDLEDYDYTTTESGLSADGLRRRKKKKKRKPARRPAAKGKGSGGPLDFTQVMPNYNSGIGSTTQANKPLAINSQYPPGFGPKSKAKAPVKKPVKRPGNVVQKPPANKQQANSQFDDKGQWIGQPKQPAKKPIKKPVKKPTNAQLANQAGIPPAENNSEFDDKGQWIGGGQMTDYDYYDETNTFNANDDDNVLEEWNQDPLGTNNNNWGENSFANADLNIDYGFQINPDMPSYEKNKNKQNAQSFSTNPQSTAPKPASSSSSNSDRNQPLTSPKPNLENPFHTGTDNRATWDAWGECTPEKIQANADLLSDEFSVLKLHNYGCWCTIIGEKRECLKGKPQDPIDTFCRDWLACRRCTLFAPHYCGRENLHNTDENAYGLQFFQSIVAGTFTCDHLSSDECAYNRCLCDKEMGEQIMCKMDIFSDIYVGVDVDDCPRHQDADYCAPDSCCGDFPHVTPWSTTCHQCNNGTRTRL